MASPLRSLAYPSYLTATMKPQSLTFALTALPFALGIGPFLQQTSNSTWIIGNDIWNITQGPVYGTQLYYQGKDAIGSAVGHYVGAGMNRVSFLQYHNPDIFRWGK